MPRVRRALVSVSDKTGLVDFARALRELDVEIVSTGGTARALAEAGIATVPIEAVTGLREMMDGRVKTLHPAVHGAILADRARPEHMRELAELEAQPIDLVAVNLYPFEVTVARPDVTLAEAIENIDIGGPAMIRSAAKNWASVAVVVSPADYPPIVTELQENRGALSDDTRHLLAQKAFAHTSAYDAAIADYLASLGDGATGSLPAGAKPTAGRGCDGARERDVRSEPDSSFPERLVFAAVKRQELRYGENPHQRAAFYVDPSAREPGLASARQLHGAELSYINLLDFDAALALVREFDRPAAAIVKHTNPCGCGVAETLVEAYRKARDGELPPFNPPGSRYGGIIAFNRVVDVATAEEVIAPKSFYHGIIAPEFDPEARALLQERKIWGPELRLLAVGELSAAGPSSSAVDATNPSSSQLTTDDWRLTTVSGGFLLQERDRHVLDPAELRVVTRRAPTEAEMTDLLFAWKVVKHVKSNAIVLARDGQVIGVGAGQMNRALPVELAIAMAGDRVPGSALASDAFFPHPDGPGHAARAGVTAIIQPGGSKKDEEAIAVADEHGVAMLFTGIRHFKH
jgi:phosphoribosylaminoimidazolecarboxamide formyltransferase/IMP cyclohydrolase